MSPGPEGGQSTSPGAGRGEEGWPHTLQCLRLVCLQVHTLCTHTWGTVSVIHIYIYIYIYIYIFKLVLYVVYPRCVIMLIIIFS